MTDNPFADRKYLKRRDDAKNHSWQFQFENDPIKESKNFSDSIYGSREAAFAAAKAHRDAFLRSAFEWGLVGPDGNPHRSDLPITLNLSPRNTSGIIGVSPEDRPRKGKRLPEVAWVANFKTEADKHAQKSFSVHSLGEKQALCKALEFRRDYVVRTATTVTVPAKRNLIENHRPAAWSYGEGIYPRHIQPSSTIPCISSIFTVLGQMTRYPTHSTGRCAIKPRSAGRVHRK